MGFLDHSTNNVIIDAVLTDTGRAFLARNDGSFSIVKFALGDDEVDYATIEKYGRTVGKERIEKNTPVFEAQTSGNNALKYRLISISNPNLVRLPAISITVNPNPVVLTTVGSVQSATITATQSIKIDTSVPPELRDAAFIVRMNNLFLTYSGHSPDSVDGENMASYLVGKTDTDVGTQGSILTFTLLSKTITNDQFTVYSSSTGPAGTIKSIITITGVSSGALATVDVSIKKDD